MGEAVKLEVGKLYRETTGRVFTITAIKQERTYLFDLDTKYYFYYLDDPNMLLSVWHHYAGNGNMQEIV